VNSSSRELQKTTENPTSAPTSFDDTLFTVTFGLFVYQDPIVLYEHDEVVCTYYNYNNAENEQSLPAQFRLARAGVAAAVLSSGVATLILFIEFLFSRVCCSRFLINTGFFVAVLTIPLAFAMFIDTRCSPFTSDTSGNDVSSCQVGDGARYALIATALFFVALVISCVTPKPLPLVRVVREMERNRRFDSCCTCFGDMFLCCDVDENRYPGLATICCCIGRRTRKKKSVFDEAKYQEGMEQTIPLSMGGQEVVMDPQGHSYKQYHDETAGFTLQNQYTAAYRRWLAFEADYEEALGRYKQECQDAEVDWRTFLKKARQRRSQSNQQQQSSADMPNGVETISDDEDNDDIYDDDELLRFIDVLLTLRENCNFAKEVMSRIQNDINELTELEDARHKQQEEKKAAAAAAAVAAATAISGYSARSKSTKPTNQTGKNQYFADSNKNSNEKDRKSSSAVVEYSSPDPPFFHPDPFYSAKAGDRDFESPLIASQRTPSGFPISFSSWTASAYYDTKASFNGSSIQDEGIEMSPSMSASAVRDPTTTITPVTQANNPTELPLGSWSGEVDGHEAHPQNDDDDIVTNTNTTTAPRRFRLGKPVANVANQIQRIDWAKWENPFHRKDRECVEDDSASE
jgi:hypothetical protein